MKITVKCPNCNQNVPHENRYCLFCGYDLSEKPGVPAEDLTEPVIPDPAEAEPAPYDGPRFCPRGHDVPDPSLGFCPVCGSPLTDAPSGPAEPEPEPGPEEVPVFPETRPAPAAIRTCGRCGYECDDPEMGFCPQCGMPFDEPAPAEEPGWRCACGKENPPDLSFCLDCGKPKGWTPASGKPARHPADDSVPEGMKPPTKWDLDIKDTSGT